MVITNPIYDILYKDNEKFIIILTGGRSSGKSFNTATFIERLTFEKRPQPDGTELCHQILYTRYTMTSAEVSVIPEFTEKIELDGTQRYFHVTKKDITNTTTGSRIMFRGIHTSSGNQTAKLKSINGITTFVVDEAEEWVNEKEFDTIMLSIRKKGIQNRIIIIMNPSDSNHFIYKRYIKDTFKWVEYDGVPVQVSTHPNVLHIHTSYLDNVEHCGEQFLKEVAEMKIKDPEKYAHIVMGRWADVAEGAIFKKWGIVDEFPDYCKQVAKGMDFGYVADVTAIVKCGIVGNRLYIDLQCYKSGMLTKDIIAALMAEDEHLHVYSDSADPRLIDEIALGGVIIYGVQKGAGSIIAGINKMLEMEIFVTRRSVELMEELRNYTWAKDKFGNYINEPIDAYNHACFTADTLITCKDGLKRIVDVKAGDVVLNSDGWHTVRETYDNGVMEVFDYYINGRKVTCTPDHRFKTKEGYKEVHDISKGDYIYMDGKETKVKSILPVNPRKENVYNFSVESLHEYTANGFLVHNCDAARYYVLSKLLGKVMQPRKVTKEKLGIY